MDFPLSPPSATEQCLVKSRRPTTTTTTSSSTGVERIDLVLRGLGAGFRVRNSLLQGPNDVGGVVAYIKKLDRQSTASMIGATVSYSDTDSITGGVGAQLFWGGDARRLILLAGGAEINNEYDDFLGTGQTAETQDSVHAVGFRYLQQIGQSDWLAGVPSHQWGQGFLTCSKKKPLC